ncbi:MAG: potassium-transporting ATPase subunit C [Nitrososphaerales archaeon]
MSKSSHIRPILVMGVLFLLICGIAFPLLVTGIGQAFFPFQANGELVKNPLNGKVVGSNWIDNNFTLPIFFHARNQSSTASKVDPDITMQDALSQVARISNATGIPEASLEAIINSNVEGTFWIFGSPYVNVLRINLVLMDDYPTIYKAYS